MALWHKKKFGVYHWDTFDNQTSLAAEADTLDKARKKLKEQYGGSIRSNGADRVEIVDSKGNIVERYNIG